MNRLAVVDLTYSDIALSQHLHHLFQYAKSYDIICREIIITINYYKIVVFSLALCIITFLRSVIYFYNHITL